MREQYLHLLRNFLQRRTCTFHTHNTLSLSLPFVETFSTKAFRATVRQEGNRRSACFRTYRKKFAISYPFPTRFSQESFRASEYSFYASSDPVQPKQSWVPEASLRFFQGKQTNGLRSIYEFTMNRLKPVRLRRWLSRRCLTRFSLRDDFVQRFFLYTADWAEHGWHLCRIFWHQICMERKLFYFFIPTGAWIIRRMNPWIQLWTANKETLHHECIFLPK